jgi:sugar/nucleoside kinase (ribokinase family)
MRIVTLGDALLDVVVLLDHGLVAGDDTSAVTRAGPGGQAANVAAWASVLGAEARFVGKLGADAAGEVVTRELAARGVAVLGPVGGHTGIVISLAAHGERTMASDRGAAPDLEPHELDLAWFDCDVLHVSGYALARTPIATAAGAAASAARTHGALVSLDVSTPLLADECFRTRVRALAPGLVFATEREREALGALETHWVVKRGARGIHADGRDWAAQPCTVVDTTGAGDALAAGYLVGGAQLGLEAAARCCGRAGTMP